MTIGYRFVIQKGAEIEALGVMSLKGDTEARSGRITGSQCAELGSSRLSRIRSENAARPGLYTSRGVRSGRGSSDDDNLDRGEDRLDAGDALVLTMTCSPLLGARVVPIRIVTPLTVLCLPGSMHLGS
jgi:hypothetical protein